MRIDVMQWNVWFEQDIEKVVDVLKEHDPDVICLQELTQGYKEQTRDNTWEYITRELGFYAVHQTMPVISGTDSWLQANAIFSRYPIIHHKEHWIHSPSPQDVASGKDQFRGYLEAVIDLEDGPQVTVGTGHMSFGEEENKAETEKLLKIIAQRDERYFMTMDSNSEPDSERMQKIGRVLVHAGPPFDEKTWTTKPHITPAFSATELDKRYDYVYTTPDVKVVDARILQTDVSDHLPILVTADVT